MKKKHFLSIEYTPAIYCACCGKPAFAIVGKPDGTILYLHRVRRGALEHIEKDGNWRIRRAQDASTY
jgi:hypothetical protein